MGKKKTTTTPAFAAEDKITNFHEVCLKKAIHVNYATAVIILI